MWKKHLPPFIILLLSSLLFACNGGIEEKQEEAIAEAHASFAAEMAVPNHELESLALYLPFGMEIDDTNPYNLLLKKGDRSYILFINPHESSDSQVVFEATVQTAKNIRLQETFSEEGKFGFIVIQDIDRDWYSLTVGIGGKKMTTEADANSLPKEAGTMMKIVSSITLTDN